MPRGCSAAPPPSSGCVLRSASTSEEIAREETGLLPPGPGADFHDDVAVGQRIFRGQEVPQLCFQRVLTGSQPCLFGTGELAQFGILLVSRHAGRLVGFL